jgi:DNA-binding response OmpR family regulator
MYAMSHRILIVDDDPHIRQVLSFALGKAGMQTAEAGDGESALGAIAAQRPDLVVLDINMPRMNGLDVCRKLRADSQVPILMLTARDDDVDKIVGLEVGADDYLTKPFNPRELVARIRSILRRASTPPPKTRGRKEHGSISIDADRREVLVDGEEVALAPKEFDLFWELLDHRGIVLTRDQLLERVWGYTFAGDTRTVDVHVRQLRRKIGEGCPVVTVWGVGYKVADSAAPVT